MRVDEKMIDSLLWEEEGNTIDFKRDQYQFIQADDNKKSEMLKDILAFANAWRRTDAFILIGVDEVKGGKSLVVGITDLLDDAAIQQFVNSKTQRPVVFSYRNVDFEGTKIAVIHVPCQDRPFFLKRDYGGLKKNTVYVRRGSSTGIADPDEIARMGATPASERSVPELEVRFADPSTRDFLDEPFVVNSLSLTIPEPHDIPDYELREQSGYTVPSFLGRRHARPAYYRELAEFTNSELTPCRPKTKY